jgi:hypothetical protein
MSTKRLTLDERAIYLLGEVAIRQLREAPRDPDSQREIAAFCRWVVHWLQPEEFAHVTTHTGFLFDEEDSEELFGPRSPK